jgi:hypothetical protein
MSMKCIYQGVFVARSLGLGTNEDLTLVNDPSRGLLAVITRQADARLWLGERGMALATLLLKGVFGPTEEGTPGERLNREVDAVAEERRKLVQGSPLLIATQEFEVQPDLSGIGRAFQDFELCF